MNVYMCIPMGEPSERVQRTKQNCLRERKLGCYKPTLVSARLRVAPEALMGLGLLYFVWTKQTQDRKKALVERDSHGLGRSRDMKKYGQGTNIC